MIRIIKYKTIRNISNELKKEIINFTDEKNKLKTDVLKINEFYKGKDANIIIEKFNKRILYLEKFINIVEIYNNYFEWISGAYNDTQKNALINLGPETVPPINNEEMFDSEILGNTELIPTENEIEGEKNDEL